MAHSKDNDIIWISASEIGRYHYCPIAWFLQKSGYKPISHHISKGEKKHLALGKSIIYIEKQDRFVKRLMYASCISVLVSLFLLFFEVI